MIPAVKTESGVPNTNKYRIKIVSTYRPKTCLSAISRIGPFIAKDAKKLKCSENLFWLTSRKKTLVFTAIAGQVENIVAQLNFKKIPCSGIHAKLDKLGRKKAMDDFRSGRSKVLVTSDLAARGLDIPGITHIVQLDVNENEDFFIHRAGRTARAGKSGINVIFGDEKELKKPFPNREKTGNRHLSEGIVRRSNPFSRTGK